jgi:hypothetical protein
MLESVKGLHGSHCKDYRAIYGFWRWKFVKQDESNGDLKFITTIKLGGKLASYWKIDRRQFQKWRGICKAYKNLISESTTWTDEW